MSVLKLPAKRTRTSAPAPARAKVYQRDEVARFGQQRQASGLVSQGPRELSGRRKALEACGAHAFQQFELAFQTGKSSIHVVICVGKSGDPFRDHGDALLNEHDPTKHMNNIAHPSHRFLPLRFKTRSTATIASSNRAMVRSIDWRAAEARPSSSSTVSGGSSRYRSTAFRTS